MAGSEARIGNWLGFTFLAASLIGAVLGTVLVEWLSKRYKDAHVRAATILFAAAAPFEIIAPLMPPANLSLLCLGVALMCGLASAVPQNSAIQRITPNRDARADHGDLPVHVHRLRRARQPVDRLHHATCVSAPMPICGRPSY
jgi:hypothetical protein